MVIKLRELDEFLARITTNKTKTWSRNAMDKTADAVKYVINYYYVITDVPKVIYSSKNANRTGLVKTGRLLKSIKVEYGDFLDMRFAKNRDNKGKKAYIYIDDDETATHYKYLINLTHRYTRKRGEYDFRNKVKDITKFKKY
jgi:hypothetical protein